MAHVDLNVALLGCGTVGSEVVRLLQQQSDDFAERCGARLNLIGIAVRDTAAPRAARVPRELLTEDAHALVRRADIVIELIGGLEPARTLMHEALAAGASVVTGNKALLATHGPELHEATAAADVDLYYEAAVAGAIPVVYALRESLAGDQVTSISGIVNGTTNYILDEMTTKGLTYEEALKAAQELGFAEADPSSDVDGYDAAAKIALMASIAFHSRVSIDDVATTGIRDVTAEQIAAASRDGYVIKLLATARRIAHPEPAITLEVAPTLVAQSHPLAAVAGAFNAVVTESDAAGRLMFYGQGAGGAPTASAVLSDVVAAAAKRVYGGHAPRELPYASLPVAPIEHSRGTFVVELTVTDAPGVLASIAQSFAARQVSIAQVRQDTLPDDASAAEEPRASRARLSIMTHTCTRGDIEAIGAELAENPHVLNVASLTPVEE
ncbi:homoserine dehydrogenase [Bowdeniella nasicola]|uniref:Homoserine dehydrogenase n=1 Tax=Bowdeniella nasicola TaxID=208480 RepID=A0A1Q5Q2Z7_9ACTO|nr:homoserine dehydrogenase [Bowdeniella nasicola]OKL54213.1 homoserine dehydrogenase [Bowdeniella nasicola]